MSIFSARYDDFLSLLWRYLLQNEEKWNSNLTGCSVIHSGKCSYKETFDITIIIAIIWNNILRKVPKETKMDFEDWCSNVTVEIFLFAYPKISYNLSMTLANGLYYSYFNASLKLVFLHCKFKLYTIRACEQYNSNNSHKILPTIQTVP